MRGSDRDSLKEDSPGPAESEAAAPQLKDSISNLTLIFQPNHQTLEGSFSSVSKPNLATKYSFFSTLLCFKAIFRDLQDLQSFAPLRSQIFDKISSNCFQFFAKNRYFSTISIEFCINFDENLSEFRRILQNLLRILQISEIFQRILRNFLKSDRILTEF